MPLYEYQCSQCTRRFEELVSSIDDEAALACPGCGATQVFRVFSTFAVGSSAPPCHGGAASPEVCSSGGGCCGHAHGRFCH